MSLLHYMSVSPKARQIVLDIFRKFPPEVGLTTHQIYEKAINEYKEETDVGPVPFPAFGKKGTEWKNKKGKTIVASLPPNPNHPIRSVRYLKKTVLETLAAQGIIEKMHKKLTIEDPQALEKWAKKRARLERRNALRLINGTTPKKLPHKETREWFWRLKAKFWDEAKGKVDEEVKGRDGTKERTEDEEKQTEEKDEKTSKELPITGS